MKHRVRRVIHYRDSRRCRQSVKQWRAEMARERRIQQKQEAILDIALEYAKMFLKQEKERLKGNIRWRKSSPYYMGGPVLTAKPLKPPKIAKLAKDAGL